MSQPPSAQDRKPGRSFDDPNQPLGQGILDRSAASSHTQEDFTSREQQSNKPVNGVAERAKAISVLRKFEELTFDNNPAPQDEAGIRRALELAAGRVGLTIEEYETLVKGDVELTELERKVLDAARAKLP